ncbi:MAG: hypothetical protein C4526_04615 [Nitrospiraceae bacterium]|nr:MAG: hypothetical protein C4526_04615 [Nitrospiraceae bacterium]
MLDNKPLNGLTPYLLQGEGLTILAHKIGRAVYYMLKRKKVRGCYVFMPLNLYKQSLNLFILYFHKMYFLKNMNGKTTKLIKKKKR